MGRLYKGGLVIRREYDRTNYAKLILKHSGAILATVSFIAILIGFGLIWIYLQIIKMPDLFLPVLTSNPTTPIAITLLSLIASFTVFLLLFLPAIVVRVSELMFKVKLGKGEKAALFLYQIFVLIVYANIFSSGSKWYGLLALVVCLLAISSLVGGYKRFVTDIPNFIGFVCASGIVGLFWVYGLLFLSKEFENVNAWDDLLSSVVLVGVLIVWVLIPVLLQSLQETKTKFPKYLEVGIALFCCASVIVIFIPHQTMNLTLYLAGIRQNPQDARYYLVDEKYKSSVLDAPTSQTASAQSTIGWKKFSDSHGMYIWGYKIFQLSDVTVLCPQPHQVNVDNYSMCIRMNGKDIHPMPRAYLPKV